MRTGKRVREIQKNFTVYCELGLDTSPSWNYTSLPYSWLRWWLECGRMILRSEIWLKIQTRELHYELLE